jgi:hypothetical protein
MAMRCADCGWVKHREAFQGVSTSTRGARLKKKKHWWSQPEWEEERITQQPYGWDEAWFCRFWDNGPPERMWICGPGYAPPTYGKPVFADDFCKHFRAERGGE